MPSCSLVSTLHDPGADRVRANGLGTHLLSGLPGGAGPSRLPSSGHHTWVASPRPRQLHAGSRPGGGEKAARRLPAAASTRKQEGLGQFAVTGRHLARGNRRQCTMTPPPPTANARPPGSRGSTSGSAPGERTPPGRWGCAGTTGPRALVLRTLDNEVGWRAPGPQRVLLLAAAAARGGLTNHGGLRPSAAHLGQLRPPAAALRLRKPTRPAFPARDFCVIKGHRGR